jgi:hypothetical protein
MISNIILRQKIDSLNDKRTELSNEKINLMEQIKSLNISKNSAYKYGRGQLSHKKNVDHSLFEKRNVLAKRILEIERQFSDINESEVNLSLLKIFQEIFTEGQLKEIRHEALRRMKGESPIKVSFSVKDSIEKSGMQEKHRKLAKDQLSKMIEFRILLTKLIEQGCLNWGESEFMLFISPLNRLIIPVGELEKIKRAHFL